MIPMIHSFVAQFGFFGLFGSDCAPMQVVLVVMIRRACLRSKLESDVKLSRPIRVLSTPDGLPGTRPHFLAFSEARNVLVNSM